MTVDGFDRLGPEKFTSLHLAVLYGDLEIAKILLHKGADPNANNENGITPLMFACANVDLELVKAFFRDGNPKEVSADNLKKSLKIAVTHSQLSIARHLVAELQKQLDENKLPELYKSFEDKETLIHLAARSGRLATLRWAIKKFSSNNIWDLNSKNKSALVIAAQCGSLELVKEILKYKSKLFNDADALDYAVRFAFSHACGADKHDTVKFFLSDESLSGFIKDSLKQSCLSEAIKRGHARTVALLLEEGVQPKPEDWRAAYDNRSVKLLKQLLQFSLGGLPQNEGKSGMSSSSGSSSDEDASEKEVYSACLQAFDAVLNNKIEILDVTVRALGDKFFRLTYSGISILEILCLTHNPKILSCVTDRIDVSQLSQKNALLLEACREGNLHLVRWFKKNGAKLALDSNQQVKSLIDACEVYDEDVAKAYVLAGVKPQQVYKNSQNKMQDGATALETAVIYNMPELAMFMLEQTRVEKLTDSFVDKLAKYACQLGLIDVVKKLILTMEDVGRIEPLLMVAIAKGHIDIVEELKSKLLSSKSSSSKSSGSKSSSLVFKDGTQKKLENLFRDACRNGKESVFDCLVSVQRDIVDVIYQQGDAYYTPLMVAANNGQAGIILKLDKAGFDRNRINSPNPKSNTTALEYACMRHHLEAVDALLGLKGEGKESVAEFPEKENDIHYMQHLLFAAYGKHTLKKNPKDAQQSKPIRKDKEKITQEDEVEPHNEEYSEGNASMLEQAKDKDIELLQLAYIHGHWNIYDAILNKKYYKEILKRGSHPSAGINSTIKKIPSDSNQWLSVQKTLLELVKLQKTLLESVKLQKTLLELVKTEPRSRSEKQQAKPIKKDKEKVTVEPGDVIKELQQIIKELQQIIKELQQIIKELQQILAMTQHFDPAHQRSVGDKVLELQKQGVSAAQALPVGDRLKMLLDFAKNRKFKELERLLKTKAADPTELPNEGRDLLAKACKFGQVGVVQQLINRGVDFNTEEYLPLALAALSGHKNVVQVLVESYLKRRDVTWENLISEHRLSLQKKLIKANKTLKHKETFNLCQKELTIIAAILEITPQDIQEITVLKNLMPYYQYIRAAFKDSLNPSELETETETETETEIEITKLDYDRFLNREDFPKRLAALKPNNKSSILGSLGVLFLLGDAQLKPAENGRSSSRSFFGGPRGRGRGGVMGFVKILSNISARSDDDDNKDNNQGSSNTFTNL